MATSGCGWGHLRLRTRVTALASPRQVERLQEELRAKDETMRYVEEEVALIRVNPIDQ